MHCSIILAFPARRYHKLQGPPNSCRGARFREIGRLREAARKGGRLDR